jgi:hypothetical protein
MGPIEDIGEGGLAFRYAADGTSPEPLRRVDILMGASASGMKSLPVVPVSDAAPKEDPPQPTAMRRCGLRFTGLASSRRRWLARFIEANAVGEV